MRVLYMDYSSTFFCVLIIAASLLFWSTPPVEAQYGSALEFEARTFLKHENELMRKLHHKEYLAAYNYNVNVTEPNRLAMVTKAVDIATASKALAIALQKSGYERVNDEFIRRQVKILSELGAAVLNEKDYLELQNTISAMQTNYATATVCSYTNTSDCTLTLEPHIQERLVNSRDPTELEWYWRQWHDKAGTPMRNNFAKYVKLTLKAANLNNYRSYADYWIHFYEDPDFEQNLDVAFNAILPLYREIHAYVRYQLRQFYGDDVVSAEGNIPMHLLGNMWGQQWDENIDLYTPYPEKPFVDVSAEMQRQGYTVQKMFDLGDQFFQSLNMRALPNSFWNLSMLTRPADRPVVCHASAWDLFQDSDVRVKMCTEVNSHYFYVVHHELGHIQYYLQYETQPTPFREAANPGFHEAVGDVIALSVSSPKHLKSIGLISSGTLDEKARINELFKTALKKIVFLPFAYTMDKFRYGVFRGEIDESTWNCAFWQMRSDFSGIEPPVVRTDRDFDPTAKYHIDADTEYLRYFAAHIFQFQFHKAMCCMSGQYVPNSSSQTLDNCDIYGSKLAGKAFSKMLSLGTSKHWKEVLEEFTGDTEMDPTALLEYFEPLYRWLKKENRRLGAPIGWKATNKVSKNCCPPFST